VCGRDGNDGVLCVQDLELPPEVMQPVAVAAESAAFATPAPGVPPSQRWLQKGNLAADHLAAGAFDSAMRLLNRSASHALHL
jgi:coatomer protein complex subunit alpha (xenin)